jgi:hypothetical protein
MTSRWKAGSTRLATIVSLSPCPLWPADISPAQARGQADVPTATQARYTCRGIASHKGWEEVRTTVLVMTG